MYGVGTSINMDQETRDYYDRHLMWMKLKMSWEEFMEYSHSVSCAEKPDGCFYSMSEMREYYHAPESTY